MIPLIKEIPELYKESRCYENCIFCGQDTDMWHESTNTPVCQSCAIRHTVTELLEVKFQSGQAIGRA